MRSGTSLSGPRSAPALHDDHDLTAWLDGGKSAATSSRSVHSSQFLMKLGEFARDSRSIVFQHFQEVPPKVTVQCGRAIRTTVKSGRDRPTTARRPLFSQLRQEPDEEKRRRHQPGRADRRR